MFYKSEVIKLAKSIENKEWDFVSKEEQDEYNVDVTLERGDLKLVFREMQGYSACLLNHQDAFTMRERSYLGKVYTRAQQDKARGCFFQKFFGYFDHKGCHHE